MTGITEEEIRGMLRTFVGSRKQYVAAKELGVSGSWLCQMLSGHKRPSGRILDFFGIERLGRTRNYRIELSRGKNKACFRLKEGS